MLKYISLSNNKLSGPIPRELCDSGSLVEINLDGNMLSGTIEDVFDRCTNLSELVLVNNRISGSIPEYISELPLKVLDLQYNNFTGVIPVSLWNSENLMEFNAASNLLEVSLSWEISNDVALEKLDLSSNMLTRQIPKKIGNLTNIQILKLNSNFFDGIIPMEFGDCISLNTLDLGSNNLNGSIPEKIADLAQLQFLDLSHNNLSGPIPSKPSSYFHELTGSIPESLGYLSSLVRLNLSGNKLYGSVPTSFGNLNGLTHLDLSCNELDDNRLEGEVPRSGIFQNLLIISLTGNKDLCGKTMGSDCQILTFGKLALVGTVVGSVLVIAIIVFVLRWWIQRSNRQSDPKETEESKRNSISKQNRKSISDRSNNALMEHLSINLAMFEPSLRGKCYWRWWLSNCIQRYYA
ncbi:hypothetical protein WN944_022799 [Citrus x changshan-huyou]|uniref:Uncharacterized protein n=1 Tax=Citrus x changshan-huyou TaxID=2935761 RepID=A0AAP0MZ90_9ROSI